MREIGSFADSACSSTLEISESRNDGHLPLVGEMSGRTEGSAVPLERFCTAAALAKEQNREFVPALLGEDG